MIHASSGEIILYGCKDGTSVTKQRVHCPMGTEANTVAQLLRKDFILRSAGRRQEVWLTSASSLIWGLVGKSVGAGFHWRALGLSHLWWGVVKETLAPALLGQQTRRFRKGSGNQAPVLSRSFGSVEGETLLLGVVWGQNFLLCLFWLYDLWFCSPVSKKQLSFLLEAVYVQFQASSANTPGSSHSVQLEFKSLQLTLMGSECCPLMLCLYLIMRLFHGIHGGNLPRICS